MQVVSLLCLFFGAAFATTIADLQSLTLTAGIDTPYDFILTTQEGETLSFEPTEGKESQYPNFLWYREEISTLTLKPCYEVSSRTYYYTAVSQIGDEDSV